MKKKSKTQQYKNADQVALVLARGAVALVLVIAIGSFGRSFYLAIVTTGHQNFPISENATQLITALGSALVGGAVGFVGGTQIQGKKDDSE